MTDPYRLHPPEVWVQARNDYLSGSSAEAVCRRYDLGLSAFRRRARKYGWRRSDQIVPPPGELDLSIYGDMALDEQIRTARLRFVAALETGRAIEARRWRRLMLELQTALNTLQYQIARGLDPEQVADVLPPGTSDETEAEADLLGDGPPASHP